MTRPPRREVSGARFDGARELDRFLRDIQMSVPTFCERNGIDRFHIQRLLKGQVKRSPPVDIVLAIAAATEGRVEPSMWREDSLRLDLDGEVPPAEESAPELRSASNDAAVPDDDIVKAAG